MEKLLHAADFVPWGHICYSLIMKLSNLLIDNKIAVINCIE